MSFIEPRYYNQEAAEYEMMQAQRQSIKDQYHAMDLAQAQQAALLNILAQQSTTPTADKTLLLLGD